MLFPSSCAFAAPLLHPLRPPVNRTTCPRQPSTRYRDRYRLIAQDISFDVIRRGPKPDPVIHKTLFDVEPIKDIDFKDMDFSTLKGCVTYVVNVASNDDYTESNYSLMARLLEDYYDSGLRIVVFPSNWYGQKETGSNEEIKKFVHETYSDKIIVMSKTDLEWSEVFALGTKYFPGDIIWNFHGKFLFNRQGIPVARFDLLTLDNTIEESVRNALADAAVDLEGAAGDETSEKP